MSGISAQYADGLEFRIKELGEQVEKLKAELKSIDGALNDLRANLTLTTSEIIWELKDKLEKLTKERDALKTVPMKYRRMQFNAELQDEVTQLQKQLAALAEQNEKMQAALKLALPCVERARDVEDCSYGRNFSEHRRDLAHKRFDAVKESIELPNLATSILNKEEGEVK